ncbi:16S rRNA (guanine(527)-N(7))-methyltransferase RsmG [Maritimibacter sp. DP1N21-5]|uniref:16S rRNA (guanine(527)-N(7))-methyltransferase RsmG n=1 Tax=Maritimibacter sp. DP1N21-5 TaxID=2836867 RepID=UPI001C45BED0|nr:16S rRNA (guanine(527)-N(7))-methyltransferase RsmG [Maritimibacter sp. DP1N21-5]MBV7411015.1 16S rRNA (guanine(527)-N(7))-methyltransferase RsmG [Maritimibacter sp. DP1N21-5]
MSRSEFAERSNVSRETLERLDVYADLLAKWNPKINLVSKGTMSELWTRHFLDSAQVFELAPVADHWLDIGTGGGFPGVVVAIIGAHQRPELKVTCVESDQRKATFLRTVLRETGVLGTVLATRVEDLAPQGADIISARALAPLSMLLGYAKRHLKPEGVALFPKGAEHQKEINDALETWSFHADKIPSRTNPDAVVLRIGDIERG